MPEIENGKTYPDLPTCVRMHIVIVHDILLSAQPYVLPGLIKPVLSKVVTDDPLRVDRIIKPLTVSVQYIASRLMGGNSTVVINIVFQIKCSCQFN